MNNTTINWKRLSKLAWNARENAQVYGETKVGAAIQDVNGNFFHGCNIEHKFRSHDIHAEVCAVSNMVSNGGKNIIEILIVSYPGFFTPCGSCMDWIKEFGNENTLIGFQASSKDEIHIFTSQELMPHYPTL